MRVHWLRICAVTAIGLGAAACGSTSTGGGGGAQAGGGGAPAGGSGKTHSTRVDPCSLASATEVSAAVGYPAAIVTATAPYGLVPPADGAAFVPGGVITNCEYYESQPKDPAAYPQVIEVTVIQRDLAKSSSSWNTDSARAQFSRIQSFNTPNQPVNGLGDAALSTGTGPGVSLFVLSGDLVISVGNSTQDVATKLMNTVLAKV